MAMGFMGCLGLHDGVPRGNVGDDSASIGLLVAGHVGKGAAQCFEPSMMPSGSCRRCERQGPPKAFLAVTEADGATARDEHPPGEV